MRPSRSTESMEMVASVEGWMRQQKHRNGGSRFRAEIEMDTGFSMLLSFLSEFVVFDSLHLERDQGWASPSPCESRWSGPSTPSMTLRGGTGTTSTGLTIVSMENIVAPNAQRRL